MADLVSRTLKEGIPSDGRIDAAREFAYEPERAYALSGGHVILADTLLLITGAFPRVDREKILRPIGSSSPHPLGGIVALYSAAEAILTRRERQRRHPDYDVFLDLAYSQLSAGEDPPLSLFTSVLAEEHLPFEDITFFPGRHVLCLREVTGFLSR